MCQKSGLHIRFSILQLDQLVNLHNPGSTPTVLGWCKLTRDLDEWRWWTCAVSNMGIYSVNNIWNHLFTYYSLAYLFYCLMYIYIYIGAEEPCWECPCCKCTKQWRDTFFLFFTVQSVPFWMLWQLERGFCWRCYGLQYLSVFQLHPPQMKLWVPCGNIIRC